MVGDQYDPTLTPHAPYPVPAEERPLHLRVLIQSVFYFSTFLWKWSCLVVGRDRRRRLFPVIVCFFSLTRCSVFLRPPPRFASWPGLIRWLRRRSSCIFLVRCVVYFLKQSFGVCMVSGALLCCDLLCTCQCSITLFQYALRGDLGTYLFLMTSDDETWVSAGIGNLKRSPRSCLTPIRGVHRLAQRARTMTSFIALSA